VPLQVNLYDPDAAWLDISDGAGGCHCCCMLNGRR
jgi:hypothetical protein